MKKILKFISVLTLAVPDFVIASATKVEIPNHSKWQTIANLTDNILRLLVVIAGISFFVFFAIGGLQYLYSAGDPAQAQKARSTLIWSIIGFLVIIVGYVALKWITGFFGYKI